VTVYVCSVCGRRVPAEVVDTRYYHGPAPPVIAKPYKVVCCDRAMHRDTDE
jgi:hypothetical protein